MRPREPSKSDAGHGASRIAAIGRHPKPSTGADIVSLPRHVRFLHWRFADAGPGARRTSFMGPASETFTKAEAASIFEPHLLVRGTRVATGDDGVRVGLCENKLTPPSSGQRR